MSDVLLEQFRQSLNRQLSFTEPLDQLLASTNARAVGYWKVQDRWLSLAGFRAVADMPAAVQTGFSQATARVPLSDESLGIVKAVVTGKPAVATLEASSTGLSGSASWLAQFEAVQSAAFPVFSQDGSVTGVLAISTAQPIRPGDSRWRLMSFLAAGLG